MRKVCQGFMQRTLTANGETYAEKIYGDEAIFEIELHLRNNADGFMVHWGLPKSISLTPRILS